MTGFFYPEWPGLTGILLLTGLAAIFFILHLRMRKQQRRQLTSGIKQLALLRLLLADFQRHRGLSTGLLSGDHSLQTDLDITRKQLETHISKARRQSTRYQTQWHRLTTQWQQICQSTTSAATNLLNHHDLIRNTIFLIEDIASELDLSSCPKEMNYLQSIWREVVQTAEWTGQARALGTGIAAAGSSSAAQRVRLRFLHAKIRQLSLTAFTALKQSKTDHLNLQQSQATVNSFLLCLEQDLLNCDRPQIDAKLYFEQATIAINDLLGLMDAALKDLQHVTKAI
ncbi:nitrate- and nitrite sensing domain-containing protein [Amphritea pacifica]|uniref:Nitrate- and nitrite sensing domain-containing protein n=1 Tax=Amphritea pacifica TaxID=2811233 RepID=A0ABS2WDG5_9GAMM|nr:nitrate- and nitrite sensing domain-containing protein [Amphritea pacifica]MBN0989748.1 nitrate- and nitrite sensing domain-containing protein [Amphritea pacifica]